VDDYLREVRPLLRRGEDVSADGPSPSEICQFDVWRPGEEVPVGHGQTRRGWVVVACLGYSRAGAGVLAFGTHTEDLLAGIAGCLVRLGGLPRTLVWDRQAGIHGHGGRPSEGVRSLLRPAAVDRHFCAPADPQAKGAVECLRGYAETTFEAGRRFASELDFQDQLDAWFDRVNARVHKTLWARPVDRLADELAVMARLSSAMPDTARPWGDPGAARPASARRHQRLQPRSCPGRSRVEVRVDQRTITAVALDTDEVACRHARVFARHRTITALEHARARRSGRRPAAGRADRRSPRA
jgi:hypothetical protein